MRVKELVFYFFASILLCTICAIRKALKPIFS